jgi:hypothetical protein
MSTDDDLVEVEPDREPTAVQKLSFMLLGRQYRLEVAAHIAARHRNGKFTVTQLATETPLNVQQIQTEIVLLGKCGFVQRIGRGAAGRVYYRVYDHEFWDFALAAAARVEHRAPALV